MSDVTGKHVTTRSTYHGGTLYSFLYDSAGRLTTITDGRATDTTRNYVTVTYSPALPSLNPTLVTITSFLGGTTGRTTKLTLSGGYATKIEKPDLKFLSPLHTAAGLLTALTDENSKVHSFAYTGAGLLKTDINPLGLSAGTRLSRSVDKTSFTVAVATPENRVTTHRVDFAPTTVTPLRTEERTHIGPIDPLDLFTVDDHFSDGRRKVTFPQLAAQFNTVTDTATTDPRFGFGAAYLASSIVTAGAVKSHTVTRLRETTMTNPADPFTVTVEKETDTDTATGSTTMSSVEAFALTGSTVTTTSALGQRRTETLDAWDRVVKIESSGNVPGLAQPLQALNITYSATTGQLTGTSFGASARPVTIKYAATTGWVTGITTPLGNVAYGSLDALGRPTQVTLPGSRIVGLSYDSAGNVKTVTTPLLFVHTLTPNPVNLLATYAPPTASGPTGSTSYGYDNDSLLISLKEPAGLTASYDRDSAGRLGTVTYPTGVGTESLTYSYELDHTKTIASALGPTLSYTYDGDMVTQEHYTGTYAHDVNKTYDNFTRLKTRNIDGLATATLDYDADGRLSTVTGTGSTYTISHTADSPNNNGMLTGTSFVAGGGTIDDHYEYNTFGEVTHYWVTYNSTTTIYDVSYMRNATTGRIDGKSEKIGPAGSYSTHLAVTYGYDARNFLLSQTGGTWDGSWTFDADGNSLTRFSVIDAQDRGVTATNGDAYGYDADGDTTSISSGWGYVYDVPGNLRRVTTASMSLDYVIDGKNQRRGYTGTGLGHVAEGYVWDDGHLIGLERSGLKAHYIYATKGHVPDVMYFNESSVWTPFRIISDPQGSVKLIVRGDDGTIPEWHDYSPLGIPATGSWARFAYMPFGFAGGLYDTNTGIYRYGARDYMPWDGRWWSKDPSRFRGGINLYVYCANDPVNCIDRNGREPGIWSLFGDGPSLGDFFGFIGSALFGPDESGPSFGDPPFGDPADAGAPGGVCTDDKGCDYESGNGNCDQKLRTKCSYRCKSDNHTFSVDVPKEKQRGGGCPYPGKSVDSSKVCPLTWGRQ